MPKPIPHKIAARGRVELWFDGRKLYFTLVDGKNRRRAGTSLWAAMVEVNRRHVELAEGTKS